MSTVQGSVKSPHGNLKENRINIFAASPDFVLNPFRPTPTSRTPKPRWFKPRVQRSHSPISVGWAAMKKKEATKKEREVRRKEIRDCREAHRTQQIFEARGFGEISSSRTQVASGRTAFKTRPSLERSCKVRRSVLKNCDHFQPPATSTPRPSHARRTVTIKASEAAKKSVLPRRSPTTKKSVTVVEPARRSSKKAMESMRKLKPSLDVDETYVGFSMRLTETGMALVESRNYWDYRRTALEEIIPADILEDIRSLLGQTKLFIDSKLPQCGELLNLYLRRKNAKKPVLESDLKGWWDLAQIEIDKMKVKFQTLRNLEANQWQPFNSEESNLAEVPKKSRKAHVGAEISAIRVELPGKSSPGLSAFLAEKRRKMRESVENEGTELDIVFIQPRRKDSDCQSSPRSTAVVSMENHTPCNIHEGTTILIRDTPRDSLEGTTILIRGNSGDFDAKINGEVASRLTRRSSGNWSPHSYHSAQCSPNGSPEQAPQNPRVEALKAAAKRRVSGKSSLRVSLAMLAVRNSMGEELKMRCRSNSFSDAGGPVSPLALPDDNNNSEPTSPQDLYSAIKSPLYSGFKFFRSFFSNE